VAEEIVVRQNAELEFDLWVPETKEPGSRFARVIHIRKLNPYGMLLASLGLCTTIVLHRYAQHYGIDLQRADIYLRYDRAFEEDCEDLREGGRNGEHIWEEIKVMGGLSEDERQSLLHVAQQCPIHTMLEVGVEVKLQLVEGLQAEVT
jgi:uncharacterized OsmC-like protein